MAGQKKNVIVGAARIFLGDPLTDIADLATWVPAPVAATPYGDTLDGDANWVDVGYTQDGLEVAYAPEYGEVEVDQLLDTPRMFKQSMNLSLNTTLAEATLTNLMVSWGQKEASLSGLELQIEGGALVEAPVERGLVAVGNGPEDLASGKYAERTYHAYRVMTVESSSHALRRNEATVFPVPYRALPADNGRYGSVRDRVV